MPHNPKRNILPITIPLIILSFLLQAASAYAGQPSPDKLEKELLARKRQAEVYYQQGLQVQGLGNLVEAMNLYTMALQLDPDYAQAYCDLGVAYEAYGVKTNAERCYLVAIEKDPYCLSAYSNLASFYEEKGDTQKAIYYWRKRAEMGPVDDAWTKKARERLAALQGGAKEDKEAKEEKSGQPIFQADEIKTLREGILSLSRQKEKEAAERGKEIAEKDRQLEALSQKLSSLAEEKDRDIAARDQEIADKDKQVKSLKKELDALRGDLSSSGNQARLEAAKDKEAISGERAYLAKEKESLAKKEEEVSAKLKELDTLIVSLKQDLSSLLPESKSR